MTRSALIMAGGRSERMRAGGCALHKALRRVGDLTLIERSLIYVSKQGFRQIWVAVSADETDLLAWLAGPGQLVAGAQALRLQILVEGRPLGTVGAARLLPRDIQDVLIVNVDNLTDLDLNRLFDQHLTNGVAMTIAVHEQSFQIPFGEVISTDGFLTKYIEKPLIRVVVSSGTYVLNRRAISIIPSCVRIQIPELTGEIRRAGERILCHRHTAQWIDVNDEHALAIAAAQFGCVSPRDGAH